MAFTNRYQKTIKGNIVQIGNTLGLSKASNSLTPGTLGSIGAFISTNSAFQLTGWGTNTVGTYTQNSSPAQLNLPAGATVDYAELIWSASSVVPGDNVTARINDAILLVDPTGTVNNITATGVNITGIALSEGGESSTNYVKSADVTSIVAAGGSGTYVCGKVPATMSATCNFLQFAGWSLYVVYTLNSEPVRNIIIFVGQTVSIDVPYSVPINYPGPPFPIRIWYTVGEGDAIITADQFNTRPGTGVVLQNIGTAIQPANSNPFASQIGDVTGNAVDTFGPFGTVNQSGTTNTNVVGGRQGWDLGNRINISSAFTGGAVANLGLDIGTNNDPALMVANGFAVDLNQPVASITKSTDKTQVRGGDTYAYTLVYRFTTVPMSTANITLVDTVPNNVTFQTGSVTLNGVQQPTFNPNPPGIALGTIQTATTFTITYIVKANTVIQTTTVPNDAYGSYAFNSGGANFVNDTISNTVVTTIDPFSATISKSVDIKFATLGDTLTYTITIPNNGATLSNVVFTDTVPAQTFFIPNSVTVNGIPQFGVTPNPPVGVILQDLTPGSFTTITFSVIVTTIPTPNPILNTGTLNSNYTLDPAAPGGATQSLNTNVAATTVNTALVGGVKSVDKSHANVGDTLTYTITLSNLGNTVATSILFIDTIPSGTTFVNGSMTQDLFTPVAGNPNPPGVLLPNAIAAGGNSVIRFQVVVNTIPNPNPIPNIASANYSYTIDPTTTPIRTGNVTTSTTTVTTQVNNASLGGITKLVSRTYADCGDTIGYTIVIPNAGNVTATNVLFKDTIPNGTVLEGGSVYVNGVQQPSANPGAGMSLGSLAAGSVTTITYTVQVQC